MEPIFTKPDLPRYTQRRFPPYRYLPFQAGDSLPHPRNDPTGHSYHQDEEYLPRFNPGEWRTCETYLYGIDLFNHGYWWEAHEAFEAVWLASGQRSTQCGIFVQGLIQLAGAQLKRFIGEPRGAKSLTRSGSDKLSTVKGLYLGIAVESFVEDAQRCLREDCSEFPRIELDFASQEENMYQEIIRFWFEELEPAQWWVKDADLDTLMMARFAGVHARATRCELFVWRANAKGRLAEIIVLDQFSRNMFRDSPLSFAYDALALALAQEAISAGAENALTQQERSFLYMPFMHSESLEIHEVAVGLFEKNGLAGNLDYELKHKRIIEQFGRYPHRNRILGRTSTAEELAFLKQPASSF